MVLVIVYHNGWKQTNLVLLTPQLIVTWETIIYIYVWGIHASKEMQT